MSGPINDVIKVLTSLGLEVTLNEKQENIPFDVAIASLGLDEMDRSLVLQVHQYSQGIVKALGLEVEGEGSSQEIDFQMLRFLLPVPIEIPQDRAPEVLRLLALANKSFPLGSLNFSEIEKSVYFSYGYPVFSIPLCEKTILMIINIILYARDNFFPLIDEVASLKQTVDNLLDLQQS